MPRRPNTSTRSRPQACYEFVLHATALPGNPNDGHTLRAVIEDTQKLAGREIVLVYVDKGYRVTMPRILATNYLMTLVRVVGPGCDVFSPNTACLRNATRLQFF
jgi:hypothetical protein